MYSSCMRETSRNGTQGDVFAIDPALGNVRPTLGCMAYPSRRLV